MGIDLYYDPFSPPCRTIQMVAAALGLQLNLKYLDLVKEEHLKPEFAKINPQRTLPTIVDDGFILWESRAIVTYLVSKYGKTRGLYPEDLQARAVVDQRLYFDIGTLYQRFLDFMMPQVMEKKSPDEALLKKVEESLALLETFLDGHQFAAGDTLTVADYCIASTVSNFECFKIDIFKYPNIKAWYNRLKTLPGFEKNEEGLLAFKKLLADFTNKQ